MVDEYQGGSDTPLEEGQPLAPALEGAVQTEQPEPITKKELEAFKKELTGELLRVIQSQTDKAQSRIAKDVDAKLKEVETTFKELKEAGYAVTEDDLKLARNQALRDVLASPRGKEQAAQPASDPRQEATIRDTNNKMRELQKQYGYVLTDNDPEFWDVPFQDSTPEQFLQKYEEGLRTVVGRLGRPLPQQQSAISGSSSARVPTPSGGATGGVEGLTRELEALQKKSFTTPSEDKRRKEIVAELMKQVPRK